MPFWKAKVNFPSNFASIFSATKHNSSLVFNIYFAQKEPIKVSILSAKAKVCQIPHANFETTSQFLVKFCIIVHCQDT